MNENKNYYEILGVSCDASFEEIQKKYRELVRKYHPDVCNLEDADEIIKEINEAYDVLSNQEKRKTYDASYNKNTQNATTYDDFDYEEEINNFTKEEKEFAKRIALEKVIEQAILKLDEVIESKYELMNTIVANPYITDDIYLDEITNWWSVSEEYIKELEKMKVEADTCTLYHMIDPLNNTINRLNDEMRDTPLTVLDVKQELTNKEKKDKIKSKIADDVSKYSEYFSHDVDYFELIDSGFVNKDNYERFRNKLVYELTCTKNNLINMSNLGSLYGIDENILNQIKDLVETTENRLAKLPDDFSQLYQDVITENYYKNVDELNEKIINLITKLGRVFDHMKIRVGNILTLSDLKALTEEYKEILNRYQNVKEKKKRYDFDFSLDEVNVIKLGKLKDLYDDVAQYREEQIEEFFEIFTLSKKRKKLANVLLNDNRLPTCACLISGFGVCGSILLKNIPIASMSATTLLTGINLFTAKQKCDIYNSNYRAGVSILQNSQETKDEYDEYCKRNKIKK